MAAEETTNQEGNVKSQFNVAQLGLNMDSSVSQVKKGMLTYALNAALENFDANSVSYQNEQGNELCLGNTETGIPVNYSIIGNHFIPEQNKHIFFIVNSETGDSQIGYMSNNDCVYRTYVKGTCLNFDVNFPIRKIVHKIANCIIDDQPSIEIYWTDGKNPRRYLDLGRFENDNNLLTDCNILKIQPDFDIPQLEVTDVVNGGELIAGTYQFAIQYCSSTGAGYTSYYSITNPLPISNTTIETLDFNYQVNKSIELTITNIDIRDYFDYYNIAVIKTINNATSAELLGTYLIDRVPAETGATTGKNTVIYSGQNKTPIPVAIEEIFEKYPYYDVAEDVTSVQDVLIWDGLKSNSRVNYQKIAADITLQWQSYKIPAGGNYADELNATELRGYLRDEVYAFEIVFLLKNGKQTDGFHIPGRSIEPADQVLVSKTNADYINSDPDSVADVEYWTVYNTAGAGITATGDPINGATPYKYGKFAYWQSTETYPTNIFAEAGLTGNIRHHKFPDILVSPAFESADPGTGSTYDVSVQGPRAIYPLGVRVDTAQIESLIQNSSLTAEEKANIAGYKIVRGNRNTNKSIVAKGILRNVGKYTRDEKTATNPTYYYYPNYPYNDLNTDPFLLAQNNAYSAQSEKYKITNVTVAGSVSYTDIFTNEPKTQAIVVQTDPQYVYSTTFPQKQGNLACDIFSPYIGKYTFVVNISVEAEGASVSTTFNYLDPYAGSTNITVTVANSPQTVLVTYIEIPGTPIGGISYTSGSKNYTLTSSDSFNPLCYPESFNGFSTDDSKYRQVFNSPETSFGQPTLGDVLKLENVMYGAGRAHFVPVKNNASYRLITRAAQQAALTSSYDVGNGDINAVFAAYQAYLQIYISAITRKNFAYSFNSVAQYDYFGNIQNGSGIKQRQLAKYQYVYPGVQSVGDDWDLNNFQRESSVYLKTIAKRSDDSAVAFLPFPNQTTSIVGKISDESRFTLSQKKKCAVPEELQPIKVVSYYGSIKNLIPNQWGQLYTYETIDTGFQVDRDSATGIKTVFGGDTFIGRFAFKTKLPFFIDNRVGAPDDSDIAFDQLGNVAYPQYWHSSRSILSDVGLGNETLQNFISRKAHHFDCPNDPIYTTLFIPTPTVPNGETQLSTVKSFYDGKMYLFAYGIPYFYCESSINLDLRQAYNGNEGNFYPRVSSGIPDDWLQQVRVPIAQDNTYYYNLSYSKQNIENFFSHLPNDWTNSTCEKEFPFRAIYSDQQSSSTTSKVNNWLLYRPISFFDFPQTYGKLTSLDNIQNKAILARFENKSLLYNTMLTIDTSNPQAAYIGNSTLFKSAPPIDFAETDLGYVGSQHKFLLKIPQGQITADAKRGQIFLISGNQSKDLTAFGSGVNRFMTDHLAFEILRYFPQADVDNHFNGVGLHGVYDSKFDRIIITKLDYIPQPAYVSSIKYGSDPTIPQTYKKYYTGQALTPNIVSVYDPQYFCNKSWTMSFNMNTMTWVSFHTYLPNYYIGESNFFYSGLNTGCNMTFVAANPIATGCELPGGSAISSGTITTTTTIAPTTTTTTTSSPIINCTLETGSAIIQVLTTTTTTTIDNCLLASGSAVTIPTTTTTTSSSTTSTTTTINPCELTDGSAIILLPTTTTTSTTSSGTTTSTTSTSTSTSTTTSTTTSAPAEIRSVTITPLNSLIGTSYTPYINGVADPSWDSGTRSYNVGTTIRIEYTSPACSVTVNGTSYSSGFNVIISSGTDYTFQLKNADHYVNNGAPFCNVNQLRQPIINDCGTTDSTIISECSCDCNVACNGTYWGGDTCSGNAKVRYQYYYCNNQPTGAVDTISSCSCDCNETCSGTYWDDSCNGTTTLTRTQRYVCNNRATGVIETITCSSSCGASTTPVWVNSGDPYCITGSCTLRQNQVQTNACAAGTTRTIDTGTASSSCGTNYWEYYCVNYGVAPYERRRREVNTCTGNTGVDELVGYDSVDCGYYSPLPSFGISASAGSSGVACTRTIGGTAYCTGGDPYIGNTIHTTDNPSSSVFAAGFYHINISGDEYIQINSSGVVVDRGSC